MNSPHDELCPPPADDDDLTLPRASINKMIKELVRKVSRMTSPGKKLYFLEISKQC